MLWCAAFPLPLLRSLELCLTSRTSHAHTCPSRGCILNVGHRLASLRGCTLMVAAQDPYHPSHGPLPVRGQIHYYFALYPVMRCHPSARLMPALVVPCRRHLVAGPLPTSACSKGSPTRATRFGQFHNAPVQGRILEQCHRVLEASIGARGAPYSVHLTPPPHWLGSCSDQQRARCTP